MEHRNVGRGPRITSGLLVTAALLLAAAAAGAQSAAPPEYRYGTIPFGDSAKQVVREIARMYRVSYAGWRNVVALELFFFREPDAPDDPASYRLFLVRKTLNTGGSGNHTEVSKILEEAITASLDASPVSYDVKFVPGLPARLSAWEAPESDIFLLVYQNIFTASDADILYRHRDLWSAYVAAAQRQSGQQTRAAGSSF